MKVRYKAIPPAPWEGIIPNYFESILGCQPPVWTSATAVPRHVFENVGYFPEGERRGEDLDTWLRIALKYSIVFSSYLGATYHLDATNRISNKETLLSINRLEKTINKALLSGEISDKNKKFLSEYIYFKKIMQAKIYLLLGKNKEARMILKECETLLFRYKRNIFLVLSYFNPEIAKSFYFFKKKIFY
jgi:hypothetical protein